MNVLLLMLTFFLVAPFQLYASDDFEIYVVRHAEKSDENPSDRDPKLSACGEARARALINEFEGVSISAVYATEYQRTQLTGRPLAESSGFGVTEYLARDYETLAQGLVAAGQTALVVGHSNTAPMIVNALAGTSLKPLSEEQYGMLYRVKFSSGDIEVSEQMQSFVCVNSYLQ